MIMSRKMPRPRYAAFGSISSNTLRVEDLVPTLAFELEQLAKTIGGIRRHRALIKEANSIDFDAHEGIDGLCVELFDALESYAPPYAYFGAHPGNGADFGFWLSEDFPDYGTFDGLKLEDLSKVPRAYTGEVLIVNDHGNMSLYACCRGQCREVWALV